MLVGSEPCIVLIAGSSSGAGKTAVAETVTRLLSMSYRTAAAKITVTHGERGCPHGGKGCQVCSSLDGDFQVISKESIIAQSGTDTARLQASGGNPVAWVITRDVALEAAWQETRSLFKNVDCIVVESNSLAAHVDPRLTLMVVDPSISRKIWKPSAVRLIATADYVIFNNRGPQLQRELLTRDIENLRGDLCDVIYVNHPYELAKDPRLIQSLKSR